ncbi:MAG TPA: glycosyltransferase WbuB [Acidimicrobiaceae bacterium]|nr:glycosyltransferase WbuB [Acidimicrobiaceae bacterium]
MFAMSPPLTLAAAASAVARRHRLPLVLNLQDLHPDAAVATGAVTARTPLRALRALERRTYRDASAITTLSPAMARTVAERAPAGKRIEVIANFVDTAAVTPGPRMNDFRRELGVPESAVLFMYAGNVGLSQPMELIRFAANRLRLRRDVCFAVNGAGVAMADVERWAAEHANVVVSGYQPGERLGEVLAAADVHLVLLRPGMGNVSVPSKVYTALAAGRPVLAAVDADSEVRRIVDDAGAGTTVDPGDPQAFVDAVLRLADDADGRTAMGDAAREHSRRHTPAGAAAAYLRLFEEVAFAGR